MSKSVYTGLNPFNFIREHFLQIRFWRVSYVRGYCSFVLIKPSSILTTKSTFRSLSAQRLSERIVLDFVIKVALHSVMCLVYT
jgi:hypothetical protein